LRSHNFRSPSAVVIAALVAALTVCAAGASAQETIVIDIVTNSWHDAVIAAIERSAARYEAANPGIDVQVRRRTGSWDDFMVQVVGGSAPDIVTTSTGLVGQFATNNIIMPLDDLIDRTNLRQTVFGPAWASLEFDGKTYAVPGVEHGPRYGQVWNKQYLDEAGISIDPDDVMNWQEFLAIADKLTRFDASGAVARMGFDPRNGQNTRSFTVGPLWNTFWIDLATGMPTLNSEEYIAGLEMLSEAIYQKYAPWTGSTDWYAIAAGTVATVNLGIYGPGEIENRVQGLEIVVGWPPHVDRKRMQQVSGWGFSIPVGASHVEESMKLIEFLATDVQFQMEMYMGVGFMGVGADFLAQLPGALTDPARLWYVTSMSRAEEIFADIPHPLTNRATTLFQQARDAVFNQTAPARQALDQANATLLQEMRTAGLIR